MTHSLPTDSKLDEAFETFVFEFRPLLSIGSKALFDKRLAQTKSAIKKLVSKQIIGKYETTNPFGSKPIEAYTRDRLRAEQHERLGELKL